MPQFSRPAFWTTVVLLAGFALPVPVAAQTPPDESSLRLSITTFAGYDTDVTDTIAHDEMPSASHGGVRAALAYRLRTEKIALSMRGSGDSRYYNADTPLSTHSFSGNTAFSADVTSRLNLGASVSALYSPRFVFSVLPAANDLELNIAPELDYGILAQRMASYAAGATAQLRVTRRSFLSASAGSGSLRLLDENYDLRTHSYGGGYSYSATRYMSLRAGYREFVSHYPAFGLGPQRRTTQRSLDAGVNYSRPLSVSRRTTLSFGTGSTAYDNERETFYAVTGNATLTHQIGRTWEANVAYARGLSVVGGFSEPFFADAVNANLRGNLTRHLSVLTSAGFANGNVGLGSLANNYNSLQGTARLEWVIRNERVGVYSNYFYQSYQFDGTPLSVATIPLQVNRHGVSAGLVFRFPLLRERTPSVTR